MKFLSAFSRIVLAVVLAGAVSASAEGISPAEYRRQLQDFTTKIKQVEENPERAGSLEAEIPGQISVTEGGREYTVHYDWLKKDIKQFQNADPPKRVAFLSQAERRLHLLDEQAKAYEATSADASPARQKLGEILARREFRTVHGPTMAQIWTEKILRWIERWLNRRHFIRGNSGRTLLEVLVYIVVAVVFAALAVWITRQFSHPQPEAAPREIIPFAPSARSWRSWLAEARERAAQEDWRNAVHLAYWAGISFLEERGAWRPDRARTPREYLRLFRPRDSHSQEALAALTRGFEVTWYGRRAAASANFAEALRELEKLGCR